ncbi:PrsW family glutamic-type intramembrane protease [Selenomonas sp. KH1T6]|uniref:PrsW family glutamic-type intramembrane protease n=1 Tax=Selenomonas sp. KH1T6 TaxID=3158784 RepID=UPI0008A73D15|nr:Protease prsW family protein [Selenomonas ruminantium]
MSIAAAFLIETIVAIVILRWLWGKKNGEKFSRKTVLAIILLAIPSVFICSLAEDTLIKSIISRGLNPLITGFIVTVFIIGTYEELAKYAVLRWVISRDQNIVSHLDIVLASVMTAMGFTLFENYGYLAAMGKSSLIRIFIPLHLLFGIIMGYYYGKARVTGKRFYHFLALALPILVHAIFDFFPLTMKYLPQDKETIDALTSLPYETDKMILVFGAVITYTAAIPILIKALRKIHKWSRNDELQERIRL